MITSLKFNSDTLSNTTNIVPLVYIEKTIADEVNIMGFSTYQLELTDINDKPLQYHPLLLNIPSISEKINIETRKFVISSVTLNLSNIEYLGEKLSDKYNLLINSNVYIYYKTQSANTLEECLKVYSGKVKRINHSNEDINLILEDMSQEKIQKQIPKNKIPDIPEIQEEYRLEPIPMVYGNVEKSPLVKYAKKINVANDGDLNEYAEKMNFLPDNIDDYILQDTININGYKYDNFIYAGYFIGGNNRFNTPLYIYDNGYGNIVNKYDNLSQSLGNNVFINSDKTIFIQKTYQEDGTPVNLISQNILEVIADCETYDPCMINPVVKNNESNNQSGLFLPEIVSRLYSRGFDISYLQTSYPNGDPVSSIVLNESLEYNGEIYQPIDTIFDKNTSVFFEGILKEGSLGDTIGENNQRLMFMCQTNSPKINYKRGAVIVNWKGYASTENLGEKPFYIKFINTGLSDPETDVGEESNIDPVLWYYKTSFNDVFFGDDPIFNDLPDSAALGTFGFMFYFPSVGEGYQTDEYTNFNVRFDQLNLSYHLELEDTNLLEKNDFYANVYGRCKEGNYYYYRDFNANFKISDNNFIDNFLDSNYNLYNFDNNVEYFILNPNDTFDNFIHYVKPDSLELSRATIDGSIDENYININFTGKVVDSEGNDNLSGEPSIPYDFNNIGIKFYNNEEIYIFKTDNNSLLDQQYGILGFLPLYKPAEIISSILKQECNYELEIPEININNVDSNYKQWKMSFTQKDTINGKDLIEEICQSTKSFGRFRGFDEKFSWNTIKDSYSEEDIDFTIPNQDIISYKYNRTKLENVKTKIKVNYNYDYATKKFTKETDEINVNQLVYLESGYNYNYYGIDENNEDSALEFESKYIRDNYTAEQLRNWLLSWHMNQHSLLTLQLSIKYNLLEVGDIIAFDKEIQGLKLYGETYTANMGLNEDGLLVDLNETYRNGQLIYPYFMIYETKKSIDKVEIKLIQLHHNDPNFFLPPPEEGEDIDLTPTGDVNLDGSVDVLDIVALIGHILGISQLTVDQGYEADLNQDSNLDILDVVQLVGIILR